MSKLRIELPTREFNARELQLKSDGARRYAQLTEG